MTTHKKSRKFSQLALALALSVGTIGGMAGFAGLTEPASAMGLRSEAASEAAATVKTSAVAIGVNPARETQQVRTSPRVVQINGFANCAVVRQMPNTAGQAAQFSCVRPM